MNRPLRKSNDEPNGRRHTDIVNFYEKIDPNGKDKFKMKSDYHLDPSAVVAIVAKSGSGKTNLALNLINYLGGFHRIIIFCGTPLKKEPIYQEMKKKQGEDYFEYWPLEDFKSVTENLATDENVKDDKILVILDDFLDADVKAMKDYANFAIKSRKLTNKTTAFMIISQSYFDIPKLMRNQVKYIFLMRDFDKDELRRICAKYSTANLTIDYLYELYLDATGSKNIVDAFMIDRLTHHDNLKFRRQITHNYIVNPKAKQDFVKIKDKHDSVN